jgi:hypothetical protein
MTSRRLSLFALVVLCSVGVAGAQDAVASLPALHLSAVVYDKHVASNGTFSSRERLTQGATHVGEDFSRCTPNSKTTVHCTGSYTLTQGSFNIAGTIANTSNTNRLTITGGTGRYKHAHGTVLTEYNRTGSRAKETITFK